MSYSRDTNFRLACPRCGGKLDLQCNFYMTAETVYAVEKKIHSRLTRHWNDGAMCNTCENVLSDEAVFAVLRPFVAVRIAEEIAEDRRSRIKGRVALAVVAALVVGACFLFFR